MTKVTIRTRAANGRSNRHLSISRKMIFQPRSTRTISYQHELPSTISGSSELAVVFAMSSTYDECGKAGVRASLSSRMHGADGRRQRSRQHRAAGNDTATAVASTLDGHVAAIQLSFVLMGVRVLVAIIYFLGDVPAPF
ncbi:hypothetical protein [Bradyrhizobium oligotrophicum]|uniref:hypothetical protein n=1 Tax=Bradyrhizobium oligotrophicum TaxID=44255 RepID=UPI00118183C5|nr:hypothetical protein [Bradyrhizobium oligotrophicum]